ncbi:unnamed protein product [Linum tenue]|uniref:Gnk2-homologous domain-containing protein n=1 Tax=Linum tenue TaxID=586396 RepID=A0AAV0NQB0_9ROSI|nr:unnamed protein product [Linum tenue]
MSFRCFLAVAAALLLFQGPLTIRAAAAAPLFHTCSNAAKNSTASGRYDVALSSLLGYLRDQTPRNDGFALGSLGSSLRDRPYGVALCRGDASAADCRSCVGNATAEILRRCPSDKSAAIWYDGCTVRYSDSDFFGRVDDRVRFYLINTANASDAASFDGKLRELMGRLAREAAYVAPRMFAEGVIEEEEKKLYGLVECSRDLGSGECKKCVGEAIGQLPRCCGGKVGGQVVGGSCRIRYEVYPFLAAGFKS